MDKKKNRLSSTGYIHHIFINISNFPSHNLNFDHHFKKDMRARKRTNRPLRLCL